MKTFVTAVGLAIGASAAILPRNDACCFQLTSSGGASGTLGQLDDGQNRIGGGHGSATYCINNGMITDSSGRGCILTAPTTQFQCDKGASPDGGFSVSGNGMLQHNDDSTFYACPANEGEYNFYTQPVDNQPKCVKVELSTGGKCAGGASSQTIKTSYGQTTPAQQTCHPAQTVTETVQGKPTTVWKTETQYKPTTEHKETTVYKTSTEQQTQVKPTTVYETKTSTFEETEYVTKPTTVYKTEQQTVTAKQPTTVYKTVEETEIVKKPTTVYDVKTEYATETAKQPPQTQYVTKTEEGKASTITKVVTQVETQQGKPMTQYVTKTEAYPQQPEQPTQYTSKPSKPIGTAPADACPTDLSGEYQYPHLIVPVSSEHRDQSYGTSYNGMMNSTISSIFNFDIPQSYQGKTCSLVFMFPKKEDLETSDYTYNGQGSMAIEHLDGVCKEGDSYNSAPKFDNHMGSVSPQPGNSYVISTGECQAGTAQSYEMMSEGGMAMDFFQDYNPSPLGLYITTC